MTTEYETDLDSENEEGSEPSPDSPDVLMDSTDSLDSVDPLETLGSIEDDASTIAPGGFSVKPPIINNVKAAPLPCGIVLFDHPDEVSNGTAYLPNVPAHRLGSPNDLRNDVIWVSNLSIFEDKIKSHPTLRSGYYFRVLLAEIAHDMGIQSSRDGQMLPDDAVNVATILTRGMTIAARVYGWDVAELGPLRVLEPFLLKDIAKMLPLPPDSRFRDDIVRALTQAYQDSSVPDWPKPTVEPDSVFVTLRYNRVNYVQQLLESPMPAGREWVRVENVQMSDSTLQYCITHPTLVKATIEWDNATTDLAALAAYGQAGKARNTMRQWMSQPELAWISQYAKVTITSIWIDKSGFQRLSPAARLPRLFTAHPEACLSYSAGLVAYNHWQALASCTWNRRSMIEESNVWATWLRALDRAMMFSMAVKAYEAGFHVNRYGGGALKLRVTRDRLIELAQFKEKHGFMYPDLASLLQRHELG